VKDKEIHIRNSTEKKVQDGYTETPLVDEVEVARE